MMLLAVVKPRVHCANRSLATAEPVSAPPKRKFEKAEQRPAAKTRARRTKTPERGSRRPARRSLTRGNVDAFPFWGTYNPETELYG
jgi:hypothetical protein